MEHPTFPDWLFLPVSVREEWALLGAAVLHSCDMSRWKSCLGLLGGVRKAGFGEQWDGFLVAFSMEKHSKGPFSLTAKCVINSGRHLCVFRNIRHTQPGVTDFRFFFIFFNFFLILLSASGRVWGDRTHLDGCGRVSLACPPHTQVLAQGLFSVMLCLGGCVCWAALW